MGRQEARRDITGEADFEAESVDMSASGGGAVLGSKLKIEYEAGASLDALCKRYRMGKLRLSEMLRAAGTAMRAPGRRSSSGRSAKSATQQYSGGK